MNRKSREKKRQIKNQTTPTPQHQKEIAYAGCDNQSKGINQSAASFLGDNRAKRENMPKGPNKKKKDTGTSV